MLYYLLTVLPAVCLEDSHPKKVLQVSHKPQIRPIEAPRVCPGGISPSSITTVPFYQKMEQDPNQDQRVPGLN